MTTQVIEGVECVAVPRKKFLCGAHEVDCYFLNTSADCRSRWKLCEAVYGAPTDVAFITLKDYPTWLANKLKGVPL